MFLSGDFLFTSLDKRHQAVLLKLISVREGAFSLSDFDDIVIKELIELICTN